MNEHDQEHREDRLRMQVNICPSYLLIRSPEFRS
jgi:hypothetical protein